MTPTSKSSARNLVIMLARRKNFGTSDGFSQGAKGTILTNWQMDKMMNQQTETESETRSVEQARFTHVSKGILQRRSQEKPPTS